MVYFVLFRPECDRDWCSDSLLLTLLKLDFVWLVRSTPTCLSTAASFRGDKSRELLSSITFRETFLLEFAGGDFRPPWLETQDRIDEEEGDRESEEELESTEKSWDGSRGGSWGCRDLIEELQDEEERYPPETWVEECPAEWLSLESRVINKCSVDEIKAKKGMCVQNEREAGMGVRDTRQKEKKIMRSTWTFSEYTSRDTYLFVRDPFARLRTKMLFGFNSREVMSVGIPSFCFLLLSLL